MRESKEQKDIIKYLEALGAYVINNHGSSYSSKGVADLSVCYKGRFIAVECKVGTNGLSEAQKLHIKRLGRSGGVTLVPYSLDDLKKQLAEVVNNGQ